jgi:hypothetical protein
VVTRMLSLLVSAVCARAAPMDECARDGRERATEKEQRTDESESGV